MSTPSPSHALKTGMKIVTPRDELYPDAHEYRIDSVIGQGGFGITYKATNLSGFRFAISETEYIWIEAGTPLAIKECFRADCMKRLSNGMVRLTGDDDSVRKGSNIRKKFIDEARAIYQCQKGLPSGQRSNLRSGLVPVYHVGSCSGESSDFYPTPNEYTGDMICFYVMPYIEGSTLKDEMLDLDPEEIVGLLYYCLKAVERLHNLRLKDGNRALHLDIKPENIIRTREGYPVLIDYGGLVSRGIHTKAYAAPEQTNSHSDDPSEPDFGDPSEATDVYGLGTTFYRLIVASELDKKAMVPPAAERVQAYKYKWPDPYTRLEGNDQCREFFGPPLSAANGENWWSEHFLHGIDKALRLDPQKRWKSVREWRKSVFSKTLYPWHGEVERKSPMPRAPRPSRQKKNSSSTPEITIPHPVPHESAHEQRPDNTRRLLIAIVAVLAVLIAGLLYLGITHNGVLHYNSEIQSN